MQVSLAIRSLYGISQYYFSIAFYLAAGTVSFVCGGFE